MTHHPDCNPEKCFLTAEECAALPEVSLSEAALEPASTYSNKLSGDGTLKPPPLFQFNELGELPQGENDEWKYQPRVMWGLCKPYKPPKTKKHTPPKGVIGSVGT